MASFHAYIIRKHRELLSKYLDDSNALKDCPIDVHERIKDDFMYEYYTFFNLISANKKPYISSQLLDNALVSVNNKRLKKLDFARVYFTDALKHIPTTQQTFNDRNRIQFA